MSENLWRPHLESYLAVREAMGHSVRAERKLLGEFLDFARPKRRCRTDPCRMGS